MPFQKGNKKGKNKKAHLDKEMRKEVGVIVERKLDNREEYKWFGSGFAPVACYSGLGYQQQNMLLITQGVADNQRVGDRLKISSIHVTAYLQGPVGWNAAGSPQTQVFRVMVFQFKVSLGVANVPAVNDIFLADTLTGVRSAASYRNIDYERNYVMLYDKTFNCPQQCSQVGSVADTYKRLIKFKVPLKYAKKNIQFSAGTTQSDGGIYIAFIGLHPSLATDGQVGCEYRVRFTDL